MRVHLVDGTWELFRAHFGAPPARAPDGREVGATRGLLRSLLALLREPGVTHVGCAFDHVIESFRNDLYPGYKTSAGVDPALLDQFPLAERAAAALGLRVWPMVEVEADDALATAAAALAADRAIDQVVIASPDKDLQQCVRGRRVICLDRARGRLIDEDAVRGRYGIPPGSIPDWLALVGDSADGFPGLPRWGARSASALLGRYDHLEAIPDDPARWQVAVRGARALAESLRDGRARALLFRRLATLRTDVALDATLGVLEWRGADRDALEALAGELGERALLERIPRWRDAG